MISNINRTLAQQIADTVKDVCGQNINFIDQSGIIFASTDETRIGTFHEIGYKAFHSGTAIEVESDNRFIGTQKGINLPIYHNQEVFAVIGISGEPQEVKKYAHLAERITFLLIREQELNLLSRNLDAKKHFIIHSFIEPKNIHQEYLKESLKDFGIDLQTAKRFILIRLDHRFHPGNTSMIEAKIEQMFDLVRLKLYTFDYPNEYLAVIDDDCFAKQRYIFEKFCCDYQDILKIAVGKACSIDQLCSSYQSALTAWKSISAGTRSFVLFDELTLEIVLSAVTKETRAEFLSKTISDLSEEEISLIKTYFENNMSLAKTCEQLFLHKNTLQYKLNHIYQKCGFNPRHFQDAVILYLAVTLSAKSASL